ncbi:15527_t:CDS:10 [Acaulospora morrowiae]|uniref:15527_t:CDS:1 n=1 Tax=Acaulospora morrowiae TaxID=94023 RepID=A0A9N9B518_9GLOM|nr:15527_t:CDS:10 [Acaulospora morrowiae]
MTTDTSSSGEILTKLDNYVQLGSSGLEVSPLCLGTMTFGQQDKADDQIKTSKIVFDKYYELGGNFFDTANFGNGDSERILGQYLTSKRSKVVISSKYMTPPSAQKSSDPNSGVLNRKSLVENLDASLKRMGIGYVDVLYTQISDYGTNVENVLRGLDDTVRSGKALYIAITDTPAWIISEANAISRLRGWSQFVALSSQYSLTDRSFEFDLRPMCMKNGIGVIPYNVISSGFLTGRYTEEYLKSDQDFPAKNTVLKYANKKNWGILEEVKDISEEVGRSPAEVAINWTLQQPGITSLVVAARNEGILDENLKALEFKLTPQQLLRLNTTSSSTEIPFPHSSQPNPIYIASQPTPEYLHALEQFKPYSVQSGEPSSSKSRKRAQSDPEGTETPVEESQSLYKKNRQ